MSSDAPAHALALREPCLHLTLPCFETSQPASYKTAVLIYVRLVLPSLAPTQDSDRRRGTLLGLGTALTWDTPFGASWLSLHTVDVESVLHPES